MRKKVFYIVLLIVCAVAVRVSLAFFNPLAIMLPDSYGYYDTGNAILASPTLPVIINPYRMPGYPIFISGIMSLTQGDQSPIDIPSSRWITITQSVLGIFSCVLLFCLLLKLSVPKGVAFGVSLFQAINVFIFPWEGTVMPEAIAQALLMGMTYVLVQLALSPTKEKYIWFGILGFLGWLVKPNLFIIPIISLPLLLLTARNRRFLRTNLTILTLSIIFPLLFVWGNISYHGYMGISRVNDIDLLGQILDFRLPLEAGKQHEYLYQTLTAYRQSTNTPTPYKYLETLDPTVDINADLQQFDRTIIIHNLFPYVTHALSSVPKIFSDTDMVELPPNLHGTALYDVFYLLQTASHVVWYAGYLVFILWPVSIVLYLKNPKPKNLVPILLGAISISQILMIVFLDFYSISTYARLASTIQPQTFLVIVLVAYSLFHKDQAKISGK